MEYLQASILIVTTNLAKPHICHCQSYSITCTDIPLQKHITDLSLSL